MIYMNFFSFDNVMNAQTMSEGTSGEVADYFTVSTDPNTGVTYLEEPVNDDQNLRISGTGGYPDHGGANTVCGFVQEGSSTDVDGATVTSVPTSSGDNPAAVMTVTGYPIPVIQWNPLQNAGTLYLVRSSAQTQSLSNSGSGGAVVGGYRGSKDQSVQYYAPPVCDKNLMCFPTVSNDSGNIFKEAAPSSYVGESVQGCSTYYRVANDNGQHFQELPLNLSTNTISNQPETIPASDYGTHLQEFARFAVDQADILPAPSVVVAAPEAECNVEKQGIIRESYLQTSLQPSRGDDSSVAGMCSGETQNVLVGTDTGRKVDISSGEGETLREEKIESKGRTDMDSSKIKLVSTTAGSKTPIIRDPPTVTRRLNLSSLQNVSFVGCSSSRTATAAADPIADVGTRILQTLSDSSCKVIPHSIVNITSENVTAKTTTNFPMPVRPKPVLGFSTGNFGSSTCSLGAGGMTTSLYPVSSALPVSLPPLSVFKAPLRFAPPTVPLLPSGLHGSHHGSRQPAVRTRVNKNRKSSLQKERKRKNAKSLSSLCHENIQNSELNLDALGRNRVDLNARERERVSLLNHGFETLRRVLPWCTKIGKRVSKVDTLRGAIAYIDFLQRLLEETEDVTAFRPVSSGM